MRRPHSPSPSFMLRLQGVGSACLALCLSALVLGVSTGCSSARLDAWYSVVFVRDGLGVETTLASVEVVDYDKGANYLGSHAAGLSSSAVPNLIPPLNVCRLESGGARATKISAFKLMDPGPTTLSGPSGAQSLTATPPLQGEGTGYTGSFAAGEIPYQAGGVYTFTNDGAEAPFFEGAIEAPDDFQMESLGYTQPGPGTIIIPSSADLRLAWAPDSSQQLYVILAAGENAILCRVKDTGSMTIKHKTLAQLPLGDATLDIERVRDLDGDVGFTGDLSVRRHLRAGIRWHFPVELQ